LKKEVQRASPAGGSGVSPEVPHYLIRLVEHKLRLRNRPVHYLR